MWKRKLYNTFNLMSGEGNLKTEQEKNIKEIAVGKKKKNSEMHTRPKASSGYWLSTLLPLCYLISTYKHPIETSTFEYTLTTISLIGLNLQSICFFLFLNYNSQIFSKFIFTFTPNTVTLLLIHYFLEKSLIFSFCYSFTILFIYQYFHVKILRLLPKSFTLGEASVVLQGLMLFLINSIVNIPTFLIKYPEMDLSKMNAIMMTALFCLIIFGFIVYVSEPFRQPIPFYCLMTIYILFVCLIPVTEDLPIITIWKFIIKDPYRIVIIAFYFGLVGLTAAAVIWRLQKSERASTSIRKIFHIIVVLVYIPGLLHECVLLYIASGVALAFLLIFEMIRLAKIPPFSEFLSKTIEIFIDEKDSGCVALTPIYLLIGCSLPLWINPISCSSGPDTSEMNLLPLLSGVLSIGIGDTAASVFGSKFGQFKWPGTSKSVEGTLANVICQSVAVICLLGLGYIQITKKVIFVTPLAIVITSLIEAFTDQVDNLVLPMIFYIISSLS